MTTWLNVYTIDIDYISIFFVLRLDCNLTCKGKCSSWFEDKRSVSNLYWLRRRITHVYVKAYFLYWEIFWLFYEKLPNIFFLCLCENRLFCLKFSWIIPDFDINYTFHHCFYLFKFTLTTNYFTTLHLLYNLFMKLFILSLFCYFATT